jgi:pyruvate/2-oxoglutarate/acetoin dehydrogenase E1 component/TPP-dependent pyruvate/acetoin dehydrogenase alpha subunit
MIDVPLLGNVQNIEEKSQTDLFKEEVIRDFWLCCLSREASLIGRKEVLTGKAKFGIFSDGKEVAQVALAKYLQPGDWRTGYYRDMTLLFALDLCSLEDFFAQLYADSKNDPFSGGRQMNSHFSSKLIDEDGKWLDQLKGVNISADVSSTAGQMGRAFGVAYASKMYRKIDRNAPNYSENGNEISICTIGDASTSEGPFWETMNGAAVTGVPLITIVYDDGYGISVPKNLQTTKSSISEALSGFAYDEKGGMRIVKIKGYDYPGMCAVFEEQIKLTRADHVPCLIHIEEMTQPLGHSTSGSHERYKSIERLKWEKENDCIKRMSEWMQAVDIVSREEAEELRLEARKVVQEARAKSRDKYYGPVKGEKSTLIEIYRKLLPLGNNKLTTYLKRINDFREPELHELIRHARKALMIIKDEDPKVKSGLEKWLWEWKNDISNRYHTHLINEKSTSALRVAEVKPEFSDDSKKINGYQVLNNFFDGALKKYPELIAFGEDVGKIGDVNQGFAGLQAKHGEQKVFDTGIREWTIIGQAIGMGIRGFKALAEIQYVDYLHYALAPLADDLASMQYRSNGIQASQTIVRTRGHRLEGIWHSGSPLGMILNSLRGIHVLTPRNMVQACGLYNTILQSNDPALVIESLNGYRMKEKMPDNLHDFTVPLGKPEKLRSGSDITLVSYGSCVRIAMQAAEELEDLGISVEVMDTQTLLPFDLEHVISQSIIKTNKLVILDEDVPGGASAFILQKILEEQKAFNFLDSSPVTITAKEHRPPYGSDGDYFSKPNVEDIVEKVYHIMNEYNPMKYSNPPIF